jgi:hypothetical protein
MTCVVQEIRELGAEILLGPFSCDGCYKTCRLFRAIRADLQYQVLSKWAKKYRNYRYKTIYALEETWILLRGFS